MAGRGCTIVIKVLGGANGEIENLSLPVALHSPLEVLKDQLHAVIGIAPNEQVLILCDLSDPERNSDVLLTGRDFMSLRDCNIRNGSVLTLHASSLSAERKQKLLHDEILAHEAAHVSSKPVYSLDTPITAAEANHRFVSKKTIDNSTK